jgi:type II secretory pathway pseudopilin PulG
MMAAEGVGDLLSRDTGPGALKAGASGFRGVLTGPPRGRFPVSSSSPGASAPRPGLPPGTHTAWVRRFGPSRPFPPTPAQRAVRWQRLTLAIVVIVLLSLIAVPQAERRARRRTAAQEAWRIKVVLGEYRHAIRSYAAEHGRPPGVAPGPDGVASERALAEQLLGTTSRAGEWGPGLPFGPYLRGDLPASPVNGERSVRVLRRGEPWPLSAEGTHGWIYDPWTGLLRLDADGRVPVLGVRYFDL